MTGRPMVPSWPTRSVVVRSGWTCRPTKRTSRCSAALTSCRTTHDLCTGSTAEMGLLTGRGTLDPRYFRHATPVLEGDMTALIEIRHPYEGEEEPIWDGELEEWIYPNDL